MPDQTTEATLYMTSAHEKDSGRYKQAQPTRETNYPRWNKQQFAPEIRFGWKLEDETPSFPFGGFGLVFEEGYICNNDISIPGAGLVMFTPIWGRF